MEANVIQTIPVFRKGEPGDHLADILLDLEKDRFKVVQSSNTNSRPRTYAERSRSRDSSVDRFSVTQPTVQVKKQLIFEETKQ